MWITNFLLGLRWLICWVRGEHLWLLPVGVPGHRRASCRVCASCNHVEWID